MHLCISKICPFGAAHGRGLHLQSCFCMPAGRPKINDHGRSARACAHACTNSHLWSRCWNLLMHLSSHCQPHTSKSQSLSRLLSRLIIYIYIYIWQFLICRLVTKNKAGGPLEAQAGSQ